MDKWLSMAQEESYNIAAAEVRAKRNQMLADTDQNMAIDRLGLKHPEDYNAFSAWLSFLRTLAGVTSGAWAVYRQKLRDIPTQAGFPYNVEWPEAPEK